MNQSFEDDLALWADLGIGNVSLISPKLKVAGWDESRRAVLDAGLRVSSMSCYRDGIAESLDFSASIGTPVLYTVTGSAGSMPWEEAAAKFCEEIAPLVARGRRSWASWSQSSPPIPCEPTSASCTASETPSISPEWRTSV